MKRVRKAVIPAAGFGTRFLPYTKATPKEMLNIVDKPSIQYIIEEAVRSGIEEVLIITARNKTPIEDHFDKSVELELHLQAKGRLDDLKMLRDISSLANISYTRQHEMLGLGHAILQAESFVGDEPFAILLPDDIVVGEVDALKQLVDAYNECGASVIGVNQVDPKNVHKYGIIDADLIGDRTYKVKNLVEKPSEADAPSNVAIMARYILTPTIFDKIRQTKAGVGGEIQLTDAIKELMQDEEIYAYDFTGKRYDAGDKLGYLKATVEFALNHETLKDDFRDYLKTLVNEL